MLLDSDIRPHNREFRRATTVALSSSQIIVQVCLFLVAAIAIFGGSLQLYLGQPDTSPRLGNVHRFMAGVYLSTGLICLWAALTVRQEGFLVYLLALGVLLAGVGRLVSISKVGLPDPPFVLTLEDESAQGEQRFMALGRNISRTAQIGGVHLPR